jgi:hypothetical protein
MRWRQILRAGAGTLAGWLREDQADGAAAPGPDRTDAPASPPGIVRGAGGVLIFEDGRYCRCRLCGLLCSTERAMERHRPDRKCLDPMTVRGPRGGCIMSIFGETRRGEPVWSYPRKVLDLRGVDGD